MQNAFWISGRARGIDHHGRVFRPGLNWPIGRILRLNCAPKPVCKAAGPVPQVDLIQIRKLGLNFANFWILCLVTDQNFCAAVLQPKPQSVRAKQHKKRQRYRADQMRCKMRNQSLRTLRQ